MSNISLEAPRLLLPAASAPVGAAPAFVLATVPPPGVVLPTGCALESVGLAMQPTIVIGVAVGAALRARPSFSCFAWAPTSAEHNSVTAHEVKTARRIMHPPASGLCKSDAQPSLSPFLPRHRLIGA